MPDKKGQTLVEMAFVLPALLVCILVLVRILVFGLNQVAMQRMAQVASNEATLHTLSGSRNYTWFRHMWGPGTRPQKPPKSIGLSTWKPYGGISTTSDLKGYLLIIELDMQSLSSSPLTAALPLIANRSSSMALINPPTPGERS